MDMDGWRSVCVSLTWDASLLQQVDFSKPNLLLEMDRLDEKVYLSLRDRTMVKSVIEGCYLKP